MKRSLWVRWVAGILITVPLSGSAGSNLPLIELAKAGESHVIRSYLKDQSSTVDVNVTQADGTTALHWAVHRDDLESAALLIEFGANVSAANVYGVTPLYLACTNRSDGMVGKLLQAGADPNAALWSGETVLMNCSRTGAVEAVAELLSAEADPNAKETSQGQTALMWAAAMRYPKVVKLLIDNGGDVAAITTGTSERLPNTCRICQWEPSPGGFTPLLFAARSGDMDSARLLLEAGADPDESTAQHGNTLVVASASGHQDLALYLLKKGANPDSADENGVTALHHSFTYALSRMHGVTYNPDYRPRPINMPSLTRALIEAGADPNVQISHSYYIGPAIRDRCESLSGMEGATPFILAAISSDVSLLRFLKESGADDGMVAKDRTTPLMAATQAACTIQNQLGEKNNTEEINKSLTAVKALIEMGADINAVNNANETAMHMAAFAGAEAVVEILAEHGALIDVRNQTGETPWSMASGISASINNRGSYGVHESTAALLLRLGATPITREQMSIPDAYSNFSELAVSIDVQEDMQEDVQEDVQE